ncbi:MAG: DUF6438 domain-containing protein [Vicingaceae bacterium]
MRFIQFLLLISLAMYSCKNSKHQTSKVNQQETKDEIVTTPISGDEVADQNKIIFSDSVLAQIQRTPCFGRCGIYTLTVYKSGYVRYKGEKWVEKEGIYEARVTPEILDKLIDFAKEINYFELENEYDNKQVTDLPATITSVRNDEGIKTIVNRYNGPNELSEFEKYFDSLFESVNWTRVGDLPRR